LHIIKNKFNRNDRGASKGAGPAAIATFATIVNPALRTGDTFSRKHKYLSKVFAVQEIKQILIMQKNARSFEV